MSNTKVSIIADPRGNAWDFASQVYVQLKRKSDEFVLNPVIVDIFRDGEIKPHIERNIRNESCFFIHDSSLAPPLWYLELSLINHALKNSSAGEIINVLPYLKFSRQDRKDRSRVPISARVVADSIEQYADRVLTIEVHNPAIQGFYSIPFDSLYSFTTVINQLKEMHPEIFDDIVIMSTDAGGAPRAKSFAKRLGDGVEVAVGYKTREIAGEVGSLKILGDVEGKSVLIIDDIVDSGNTLVAACNAARSMGAKKVFAYCTHGLFTKGVNYVVDNFDAFFIGNTLGRPFHPKLQEISFVELFAEAIYRIKKGESLSELFE